MLKHAFTVGSAAVLILIAGIFYWSNSSHEVEDTRLEPTSSSSMQHELQKGEVLDSGENRVSVPEPSPDSLERATQIEVVSDSGEPLTGVKLLAQRSDDTKSLGVTNKGTLTAKLEAACQLIAQHPRFNDAMQEVGNVIPKTVRIVMVPVPVIQGVVLLPSGQGAGPGINVVGYRDPAECDAARFALGGTREAGQLQLFATSDEESRFAMRVPNPDSNYTLSAGGLGFMVKHELRMLRAGEDRAEIVVYPIYAARIQLTDQDNSLLRVPDGLCLEPGTIVKRSKDQGLGAEYFDYTSIGALLAGIDPAWIDGPNLWRNMFTLCTLPDAVPAVGPFVLAVNMPGYAPAEFEYMAYPLSAGLSTTTLALNPIALGWGDLNVDFVLGENVSGSASAVDLKLPMASINLTQQGRIQFKLDIRRLSSERIVFKNIPWGTYEASVLFEHKQGRALLEHEKSAQVIIGPEPAQLTVDVAGLGSLELEVFDSSGNVWKGELQASIGKPGKGFSLVSFRGPPYFVHGLAPSSYEVGLLLPFMWSPSKERGTGVVEVTGGAVTQVQIKAP